MTIPVTELGNRLAGELWRSGLPRPKAFEVGKVFEDLQRDRDDLVDLCRLLEPVFLPPDVVEGQGSHSLDGDTYRRFEALWQRLGPHDG